MQLTQHRLGIGILAVIMFVMLALTQTANADTSYNHSENHDQRWSDERKDNQRCDEGYWKTDGSWHSGMDGKSDHGYWDDNGCWRDTPRDDDQKDRRTDDDCWRDSSDHKQVSWNDSRNDGKDGKHDRDGNDDNGRDGKDSHGDYGRSDYQHHSSAFSSVRSLINARSDVHVSLR